MDVKDFQTFISSDEQLLALGTVVKKVNLLKLTLPQPLVDPGRRGIGRGRLPNAPLGALPQQRVALVLDAEQCLDRLYGGWYPDWSCGGEWRNMMTFLATLFSTMQQANIYLAVFFNGSIEPSRFKEWKEEQCQNKQRVKKVFNHLLRRGTPPPKAFWVPPCGLRTMLKMALRSLNVIVLNSVEDHRLEMMGFCWENGYHGVMSDDGEMALFYPPRYFSAHSLKLSLSHDLMTTEYVVDEVAKNLDLNPNRFCLLGTLLGNHILPSTDLVDFYMRLIPEMDDSSNKVGVGRLLRAIVTYVRALTSITDFEKIGADVFGSSKDSRIKKLRDSVKYYESGTREGYAKLKPTILAAKKRSGDNLKMSCEENEVETNSEIVKKERRKNSKKDASQAANLVERIALDLDQLDLTEVSDLVTNSGSEEEKEPKSVVKALASGAEVAPSEAGKYPTKAAVRAINIPDPPNEVRRVALERHRQGQMSPYVCQVLRRGEIKLPVLLEDENSPDFPPIHRLYQPLRQSVYAILFNLHHLNYNRKQTEDRIRTLKKSLGEAKKQDEKSDISDEEKIAIEKKIDDIAKELTSLSPPPKPEFCVREWVPYNDYNTPDVVEPVELSWGVPTIQRLWFSTATEDKEKRLRAFLTCMRCDDIQALVIPGNIPQHVMMLTCVLRYIMKSTKMSLLQKPELDAFLVTALSPEIGNQKYLAEMTLDYVTTRGVQLATMFMEGLEMAIMANDACGAPVPSDVCMPTFFDGKLFHFKLRRAASARNLMELCDGRVDIAEQVERARAVILTGLLPFPLNHPQQFAPVSNHFQPIHPSNVGRGGLAGSGRQGAGNGGRLIVGGSVVSQWDSNRGGSGQTRGGRQKKVDRKSVRPGKPKSHKGSFEAKSSNGVAADVGSSNHVNGN